MNFNSIIIFNHFCFICTRMVCCTLPSIERMELSPLRSEVQKVDIIIGKRSEIVRHKRCFKKFFTFNLIAYYLAVINNNLKIIALNSYPFTVNIKIKVTVSIIVFWLRHRINNKLFKRNFIILFNA